MAASEMEIVIVKKVEKMLDNGKPVSYNGSIRGGDYQMSATINQVARKAGVSKATVSRVINDSKPVRPETRQRVLKAIEELGFRPSSTARSLVYKKSRTLGVIVTDIDNLFVSMLVKGIEEIAYSKGYNIIICNSHSSDQKEIELLMMLQNKQVDGIVFLTSHLRQEHKSFFKESKIPISLVNVSYDEENLVGIRIDNRKAAYDLTGYFLKKGYTRVGMIRAPLEDQYTGLERFEGYRQALHDFGVPYDDRLVKTGSLDTADGYRVGLEILRDRLNLEAIFVACDLMAFGTMKAFFDHGLRIPEDIEVAGFDDVPMASYYHPSLTTVHQPIGQMGCLAAEMLIKLIEGKEIDRWEIVLPHELVFRDSTAKDVIRSRQAAD